MAGTNATGKLADAVGTHHPSPPLLQEGQGLPRGPPRPEGSTEPHAEHARDAGKIGFPIDLLSLLRGHPGPQMLPPESGSTFRQSDGSFRCNWDALKSGEAFCSSVNACCTFCLSRALGGPSALSAALLEKLRGEAKVAIEEEVGRLVQVVRETAAAAQTEGPCGHAEAAEKATQELLKHPALQAVAFLSVHERRLAVFEIWLDRWQVLCRDYHCTCGSAEAALDGLSKVASSAASSGNAGSDSDTKAAVEDLKTQVSRLREEAHTAQQEEEGTVSEARSLSMALVTKQQQFLQAVERVKALEKIRADPAFAIMQRAQQQLSFASPEGLFASYKEPLSFIEEKCNKLADLARLMQQQSTQPLTGASLLRSSWTASQSLGTALGEEDASVRAGDAGLLGALGSLQTPHASLHSPRSQRARISSRFASPVAQGEAQATVSAARDGEEAPRRGDFAEILHCLQREGPKGSPAKNGQPLNREPDRKDVVEQEPPLVAPAGTLVCQAPEASPASCQRRMQARAEAGSSSKRIRPVKNSLLSSLWGRSPPPGAAHADLDMDTEAAWPPMEQKRGRKTEAQVSSKTDTRHGGSAGGHL
ncbi:hypothetical protein cyc_03095 [Cyclospora cayetanensis]|uniref:Uncharacterized protein n=1 Tax=Cyclospora cayetanensis TaxID=88456 RepID=A0A1D3D476_9EIME|nr:hypothetical protein cyc_03095 [Cyclospora cayetanensis]